MKYKEHQGETTQAFTYPVHPAQHELAFHPLDEEFVGDCVSCAVSINDITVRANPLYPSDTITRMLEQQCMLKKPQILTKRSSIRRRMLQQQVIFTNKTDPESRLSMIAAQPTVIAPVMETPSARLQEITTEHALLRAICATSSESFGDSAPLMNRLQTRYGADIPHHEALTTELFPTPENSSLAHELAMFDLYLRSYAASIYMDPLQIATLAEIQSPERILHSQFLLWDDTTLLGLACSSFGEKLIEIAPPNISATVGILAG